MAVVICFKPRVWQAFSQTGGTDSASVKLIYSSSLCGYKILKYPHGIIYKFTFFFSLHLCFIVFRILVQNSLDLNLAVIIWVWVPISDPLCLHDLFIHCSLSLHAGATVAWKTARKPQSLLMYSRSFQCIFILCLNKFLFKPRETAYACIHSGRTDAYTKSRLAQSELPSSQLIEERMKMES